MKYLQHNSANRKKRWKVTQCPWILLGYPVCGAYKYRHISGNKHSKLRFWIPLVSVKYCADNYKPILPLEMAQPYEKMAQEYAHGREREMCRMSRFVTRYQKLQSSWPSVSSTSDLQFIYIYAFFQTPPSPQIFSFYILLSAVYSQTRQSLLLSYCQKTSVTQILNHMQNYSPLFSNS
jgi:hypothetical protein